MHIAARWASHQDIRVDWREECDKENRTESGVM